MGGISRGVGCHERRGVGEARNDRKQQNVSFPHLSFLTVVVVLFESYVCTCLLRYSGAEPFSW
jgi:hypothetical protein